MINTLRSIHRTAGLALLPAFTLVPLVQAADPIYLEGATLNGMAFSGRVARLSASTLFLETEPGGHAAEMGIPLTGLQYVSLVREDPFTLNDASRLETLFPLIPYWNFTTVDRILQWVRALGLAGRWQEAWSWAEGMEGAVRDPGQRVEALLLKSVALLEMGLFAELRESLRPLNQQFEPMSAPTALCRLNARSLEHLGQIAAARFWAALPALRIPVPDDAAAQDCAALAGRFKQQHPEISPALPFAP